ncbi:MAG: class I SAM-dependent methyltransferase [Phycisphaerales bacterium]|nr:class I SAM-dependent methyltransferase [Phycisphaerales bacterium]
MFDRHALYELCVQDAPAAVGLLREIHGGGASRLAEDFCGSAAVSRAWARLVPGGRAVAADIDAAPLAYAEARAREEGVASAVGFVKADVLADERIGEAAEVIFVGNFSIGEVHGRGVLLAYLRRCAARLAPGGVLVCDTYGGPTAFGAGGLTRTRLLRLAGGGSAVVRYAWEQRGGDWRTGMVETALHFRVEVGGEVVRELPAAFVYRWRLWSPRELAEAMEEAGLKFGGVRSGLEVGGGSGGEVESGGAVVVWGRREK